MRLCLHTMYWNKVLFTVSHGFWAIPMDTHSAPPTCWRVCVASSKLDATPGSPTSCRSCFSRGVGSNVRWPPLWLKSDWLTDRSAPCPRRGEGAGGPQSGSMQPAGRSVPPPELRVPRRIWEWLEGMFTMFDLRMCTQRSRRCSVNMFYCTTTFRVSVF